MHLVPLQARYFVSARPEFLTGNTGPHFTVFLAEAPQGWGTGKPMRPISPADYALHHTTLTQGAEWLQIPGPPRIISHLERANLVRKHLLERHGYPSDSPTEKVQLITDHIVRVRDWWAIYVGLAEELQLPYWEERAPILHHADPTDDQHIQHSHINELRERIQHLWPEFNLSATQLHTMMPSFIAVGEEGFQVMDGLMRKVKR